MFGCVLGLSVTGWVAGCSKGEPTAEIVYPIEAEVNAAFQAQMTSGIKAASPRSLPQSAASPAGGSAKTQLASFANRSKRPVRWSFGGFNDTTAGVKPAVASATQLVQTAAAGSAGGLAENNQSAPSASDVRPVEVVPTPSARPEIKAELIPTPPGVPLARIAAEIEGGKKEGDTTAMEIAAVGKTIPGQPALIDPATDAGLVGAESGPEDYRNWAAPEAVLFVTGNQHGYIEPCGCTGLENQKGGVARRYTFMKQLRDLGWPLVPIDAGNQIRRIGQQASIKFEKSSSALSQMKYQGVGLGPSDMRLSATDLIAVTYADSPEKAMYVSGNIVILDPSLLPSHKIVRQGEFNIGLTSILDPESLEAKVGSDVTINEIKESAQKVLAVMNAAGANFRVLTFFGKEEAAEQLMVDVPGYDLIVVSGGYGEPTYRPQSIEGSKTKLIVTGNKGMYAGLVGLYSNQPMKYARVPLTHEFKDAPEMRQLMKEYQQQLEQLGFSGLGLSPIPHPSGEKFVGSKVCGDCHTQAYKVWNGTPHSHATQSLVKPPEGRGDVPRHFDPECISCHVTGWNAQKYYPYVSGYWDLEQSAHLTSVGCESCHGPGSSHAAAELANADVSEERRNSLRLAMQLPLEKAKEQCMNCHDLDNSPDFHDDDAFEDEYWPQVEHYGMD